MQEYHKVQNIALQTLYDIKHVIKEGLSEKDIVEECQRLLVSYGLTESWYHGILAFVLVGERTTLSISGREYLPSELTVKNHDLITIDLSPEKDGFWGDCARSYIVENGIVTDDPNNASLSEGVKIEKKLHKIMQTVVTPQTTMHELFVAINREIQNMEYVNLDFRRNLGHSIEKDINARRYIEEGNHTCLGDVPLFTFEPHIRHKDGQWGFKRENIYYFEKGEIFTLGNQELLEKL